MSQTVGTKELSIKLGLCTKTIYNLLNTGKIPKPKRVGHQYRWRVEDVEAYLRDTGGGQ